MKARRQKEEEMKIGRAKRRLEMRPKKLILTIAIALLTMTLYAGYATADTDPSVDIGYSATAVGTVETALTSDSWSLTSSEVVQTGSTTTVSFLNSTGAALASVDIVATYSNASDHTFTINDLGGGTPALSSNSFSNTSSTATFAFSGTPTIPSGDYLVFSYTNWNTNDSSVLSSFTFTATGGAPPAVPEPSTLMLIGSGLVGLTAFRKRFKKA